MSDAASLAKPTPSPSKRLAPDRPGQEPGSASKHAHFIPVSRYGLRAKLVEMLKEDGADERQWQRALDCLAAWRHQQYRMRMLDLLEDYLPFSPDSDTASLIDTKIAFKPFDKLKLFVTCGGGTAAGVMGTATKILAATNPFTLAFGLLGFSAVVFRQVMNFFNTRNCYMMVLAQNLYFCSLANNRGALTLIADAAEEEDVKEDMLLYAFLAKEHGRGAKLGVVKQRIGSFLSERCGVEVSFDADDALRRLVADGLVKKDGKGTATALGADAAQTHLDRLWDRLLDVDALDGLTKTRGSL